MSKQTERITYWPIFLGKAGPDLVKTYRPCLTYVIFMLKVYLITVFLIVYCELLLYSPHTHPLVHYCLSMTDCSVCLLLTCESRKIFAAKLSFGWCWRWSLLSNTTGTVG